MQVGELSHYMTISDRNTELKVVSDQQSVLTAKRPCVFIIMSGAAYSFYMY